MRAYRTPAAVIVCALLLVGIPSPVRAAAEDSGGLFRGIEISAFLDGYTGFALPGFDQRDVQLRAFDTEQRPRLSYVEIALDKKTTPESRLGFRLDLGAGATADVVGAVDPSSARDSFKYIQQAYLGVLVPIGQGLQIEGGKFVTPHGTEVIESRDNGNYTRGLLFTWAIPFYHFGVRAKYAFSDHSGRRRAKCRGAAPG